MTIPSPAIVAARYARAQGPLDAHALSKRLRQENPDLARAVASLGIDVEEDFEKWLERVGKERVRLWMMPDQTALDVLREWQSVADLELPLIAVFVMEWRLGTLGTDLGPYFRSSGSSFAREIVNARWKVAQALRGHSASVRFFEPLVLGRTCILTRRYYEALRPFADDGDPNRSSVRIDREIARHTVMASRFGGATEAELRTAIASLDSLIENRDDHQAALLWIEASLEIYHASKERSVLEEALSFARSRPVPSNDWPQWHLVVAELWLNLLEHGGTQAHERFIKKAKESLRCLVEQELDVVHEIRWRLLHALCGFLARESDANYSLWRVRLPFLLRTASDLPPVVVASAGQLIEALQPAADRGQYQYREFLAELQSKMARVDRTNQQLLRLRESTRLRRAVGQKHALSGTRDRLSQAQDLFALSRLSADRAARAEGVSVLLDVLRERPFASEPLVLLATELEAKGPISPRAGSADPTLMAAMSTGDYEKVFALGAVAAFRDQTLQVSELGGRGKTFTVSDFSGFTGQTFVFKTAPSPAVLRDKSRAIALSKHLEAQRVSPHFGVIEHLTELDIPELGSADELVSVRRFAHGVTLRSALEASPGDQRRALLSRAAQFLGIIHSFERRPNADAPAARRQVKEKELGRWLKRLVGPSNYLDFFDSWWSMFRDLPMMSRRDAHSLNWIVDDASQVLAADLEAQGERPVCYELAQLIDDYPVLAPSDSTSRAVVLSSYAQKIGFDARDLESAFEASVAARAVGLLSDPLSSSVGHSHGYALLSHTSAHARDGELRAWADELMNAWQLKVGLADPSRFRTIEPSDRVRISKAMAYHLRHDPTAQVTRGGWIYAEDLAEVMQANGHRVTAEQLLVVAGALGEPRFQLDGSEIRAAYGHSLRRREDYGSGQIPDRLYHATPAENLSKIVEAQAGLEPRGRQYVHLTPDVDGALASAARHGGATILLTARGASIPNLVRAAEDTWLAPHVPATALEVVPLHAI
ncbi:RNA 2'-phosphotransferase [Microbacterium maritypicum]|uniref:RNA 2'-phosphotransferase n=1 Tax=Microbacterium maritypicum TaxID=33918 RepID=UPI0037FBF9B0